KSDRGELGAGRRADNRAHRACRKHRVLFERAQIEITPSLAATARKAELGKASEAPSAIPGEPVRLPGPSATIPTPERIEVRSRLGFDREIDDGTHRDYSAAVTRRRRGDRSRAARALRRDPCCRTRRSGRLAARARDPARHSRADADSG